jgi:hypothetical protein
MNTVELIHAEFDNAQEIILKEAQEIIECNVVKNMEHVEALKKLGFVNSQEVEKNEEKIKKSKMGNELAKLVMYYKQTYPFLKFLTEEKLDEICEKWGLVHASVKSYKRDVPPKNVNELLNAQQLRSDDARPDKYRFTKIDCATGHGEDTIKWLAETEFDFDPCKNHLSTDIIMKKMCPHKFDKNLFLFWTGSRTEKCNKEGLYIAAPADHFDLKGLEKKGKFGFFEKRVVKIIQDPIVFRYVKGGIQVLSKWGPEAEDPNTFNEINN